MTTYRARDKTRTADDSSRGISGAKKKGVVMVLTVLGPELEGADFTLEEHSQCVILKYRGQEIERFGATDTTVKRIKEAAWGWLKEHGRP